MYAMDAIGEVLKREHISARNVGRLMGMGDNYVARIMNRGSVPRCDTMARMLNVCGYELCAVPRERVTPEMLAITATDTE